MAAVSATGIEKSYDGHQALRDVGFSVSEGEIFGIIGPDGAGKTTLFRILATLLSADRGKATVCGLDVDKEYKHIRRKVGYMPGRFSLYQDMSVEENLAFFATLFNTSIAENYGLIKDIYVQIEPFKKRRAGNLSGGMKQKLALCCALIHKPAVLFLDEPTTGVDPVSRKELWEMLKRLKEQGISILVSTPYMDEAGMCDRIALMNEGRFMTTDTPAGIIASYGERLWAVSGSDMPRLLGDLMETPGIKTSFAFGDVHHVTVTDGFSETRLEKELADKGHANLNITKIEPGIEDCYMLLTR